MLKDILPYCCHANRSIMGVFTRLFLRRRKNNPVYIENYQCCLLHHQICIRIVQKAKKNCQSGNKTLLSLSKGPETGLPFCNI